MYCIYQFTNGDSWAAKTLAGVSLAGFTGVLAFFTWRIHSKAHQYKKLDGDCSRLYEDKETWIKYNLFYENYKKSHWCYSFVSSSTCLQGVQSLRVGTGMAFTRLAAK